MKIETTLGTVILVGGAAFLVGVQYGCYRAKEKAMSQIGRVLETEFRKL